MNDAFRYGCIFVVLCLVCWIVQLNYKGLGMVFVLACLSALLTEFACRKMGLIV